MTDKQYNEALSVLKSTRPVGRPPKPKEPKKAVGRPKGTPNPNGGRPKGEVVKGEHVNIRITAEEKTKAAASGLTQREIFLKGLNSI